MEPPVSVPRASGIMPAATAAAEPPLLPPGTRSGSHGLRVGPNPEFSVDDPIANSSKLVFPTMTAPAAFSREQTGEQFGGRGVNQGGYSVSIIGGTLKNPSS